MVLYESKSRPWNALELLEGISAKDIHLSEDVREEFERLIWHDLCSEYDAEHFCLMLEDSGLSFSEEFISFEKVWRRDEYNHYLGMRRIYHLLHGEDEQSITERLKQRVPDFADMKEFFTDEFKLCIVLAYDELVSTRAYNEDVPLYRSLGPKEFNTWIQNVRGDEALHYLNSLRVAQARHRERLPEAGAILQRILEIDLSEDKRYQATFILDHTGLPAFTPQLLRECADTVLEVLSRPVPSTGFY
jgi:hypothetical protein